MTHLENLTGVQLEESGMIAVDLNPDVNASEFPKVIEISEQPELFLVDTGIAIARAVTIEHEDGKREKVMEDANMEGFASNKCPLSLIADMLMHRIQTEDSLSQLYRRGLAARLELLRIVIEVLEDSEDQQTQ
jgi:hypothetical protein